MSFGHVCDKLVWMLPGMVAAGAVLWGLYVKDPDFALCVRKEIAKQYLFFSLAGMVLLPKEICEEAPGVRVCYAGILGYLIVAAVMDSQLQMVSDFLHGIGLISASAIAFCRKTEPEVWWSFLMFCLVQYIVFRHMYGPADVVLFIICALFFAAEGKELEMYLLHMALSFAMLGAVQLFRGNVSRRGNLKEPVALVPYLAISFFVII